MVPEEITFLMEVKYPGKLNMFCHSPPTQHDGRGGQHWLVPALKKPVGAPVLCCSF